MLTSLVIIIVTNFVSMKEKLCLLVMSLPAHQLCLQPLITAVKVFLLDNLPDLANMHMQWCRKQIKSGEAIGTC